MSDAQVLEYVKRAMQQGKGQQEIAVELLSQGVTEEQALRVKEMYHDKWEVHLPLQISSRQAVTASRMRQIQGSSTQGVQKQVFATLEEANLHLPTERTNTASDSTKATEQLPSWQTLLNFP